jgi:hypothetical protein
MFTGKEAHQWHTLQIVYKGNRKYDRIDIETIFYQKHDINKICNLLGFPNLFKIRNKL